MFEKSLLKDKVVLVTGGGSGIGFTIAESCLKHGAKVMIASRKEDRLKLACEELEQEGEVEYAVCDIRQVEEVEQLAQKIRKRFGRLDILVNNAGGQFPSRAEDISANGWNAVINNNLNGTWNVTQFMAKEFFIPEDQGIIINIIANIFRGFPGMVHTGAARAGVDNMTKTLAVEWSHYNIRINAVAPGIIRSTGLKNYPPELLKGLSDNIPARKLGETQDVANLVLFLSSPLAVYITGETIYVDGGQRLYGEAFKISN
jgi:citronellol/citronellal dehydrogenase